MCRVDREERRSQSVVESPAQRQFSGLAGHSLRHNRSMASQYYVLDNIRFVFHANRFAAMLWLFPTFRRQIQAVRIEGLNVYVLDGGPEVGKSPRDFLIVSNDHIRIPRKTDPSHI